jgi:hypothetical protein
MRTDCRSALFGPRRILATLVGFALLGCHVSAAELTISGTRFQLDGKPFPYTGISFFNAIYNPAFNQSSDIRRDWLRKFREHGIDVLRVWAQWDNTRGFVDASPTSTLYHKDGTLRTQHVARLKEILTDADAEGFVIELCLFSQESFKDKIQLDPEPQDRAVAALTRELMPYRNLFLQIWNEKSFRTLDILKVIKAADSKRLVTSSPGFSGVLGTDEENQALDFLTPHTSRQGRGRTWEIAPREIASLLAKFHKPVVDDEPARNGTSSFGGPKSPTFPTDHILQIHAVWQIGGYVTYHHDMFQTGYGTPACPPSGIPEPDFSPYHSVVFDFLAHRERYWPDTGNSPASSK